MIADEENETGKKVLILGLSQGNIDRLTKGQPILVSQETHGKGVPEGLEIAVLFGETEQSLLKQMQDSGAVGSHTKVHRDLKLKENR